jgi:hypothetical protein
MWQKLRKILGILTDILIKGREAGAWSETHQIGDNSGTLEKPHEPGTRH